MIDFVEQRFAIIYTGTRPSISWGSLLVFIIPLVVLLFLYWSYYLFSGLINSLVVLLVLQRFFNVLLFLLCFFIVFHWFFVDSVYLPFSSDFFFVHFFY